jgi:hypothetical protein
MMNATPGNLFSVVCNGYILPYTFWNIDHFLHSTVYLAD